ncbi:hypothetical protein UPYG_G00028050 [Umbra pygmaea]|uniref:Amino acid transporter transmembrane domain-containing protein n=1 Tax=Umbra pygmaea TaxID=75934 RepID=A0ABD0XM57_UMBPY
MMATAAEEIYHSPCPITERNVTTLPIKITRKNQDKPWKLRLIYLQCYCMSIATILGTGILGLPVTIAHAGLMPFLVSFIIGFFVQALLIYLFVELLQRCQVAQIESLKSTETVRIPMLDIGLEDCAVNNTEEEYDGNEADTGLLQKDAVVGQTAEENLQPNLHVLGLFFLSKPMSHAFNFILIFQFVSIGISYVLAGSEAYAALLDVSHVYIIPAFTWTLSLGILLAQTVIQPITSLLTLFKGIMLIITVAVTFAVGSEVQQETTNDFSQIGKPFLMGTVALGGIVNVMPLLFSEISHNKTQIMWFRRVILGGLTTCTILNILWCWAVLEIVPQVSVHRVMEGVVNNTGALLPDSSAHGYTLIFSNISLEASEKAGEIATIPLTKIISVKYRRYSWVAELIQVFIAVSITVSFLVMGSAMKHTIDGLVNSHCNTKLEWITKVWERTLPQSFHRCSSRGFASGLMSILAFGIIFIVSSCDPRGFVLMLDKVVSFSLNTEVGLFIFLMLRASRSERFQHLMVPLPVGQWVFQLYWILPIYFMFAVTYDVIQTIVEIAEYNLQPSSQRTLTNSSVL